MHELSIAQSILEAVRTEASVRGIEAVTGVGIEVGALSGVMPDALQFCFDAIVHGTPESAMTLHIDPVPVVADCRSCGSRFEVEDLLFRCPACESSAIDVRSGMDMRIVWLESDRTEPVTGSY